MAKIDTVHSIMAERRNADNFVFENLMGKKVTDFFTYQDIDYLYSIATSARYSANIRLKFKLIDDLMKARGFKKFTGGTNRLVYRNNMDHGLLVKVAFDRTGVTDSIREYENQFILSPCTCRVFDVSLNGVLATVERVIPINTREEFWNARKDIYKVILHRVLGVYIMDDIGIDFYMNWGVRPGFGPVLLDFPYLYEVDPKKIYCDKTDMSTGIRCGGLLDYDDGFNKIICIECGAERQARDMALDKKPQKYDFEVEKKGLSKVNIYLEINGKVLVGTKESSFIEKPVAAISKPKGNDKLKVSVVRTNEDGTETILTADNNGPKIEQEEERSIKVQVLINGEVYTGKSDEDLEDNSNESDDTVEVINTDVDLEDNSNESDDTVDNYTEESVTDVDLEDNSNESDDNVKVDNTDVDLEDNSNESVPIDYIPMKEEDKQKVFDKFKDPGIEEEDTGKPKSRRTNSKKTTTTDKPKTTRGRKPSTKKETKSNSKPVIDNY